MIELKLKEFLQDSDAIRNRVGSRFGAGYLKQGLRGDSIVLQEISSTPAHHLQGEAGIEEKVVQVDCYSDTPRKAESLAQLVRNRLSGYRGSIGKTDPQHCQSFRIISSGQEFEEPEDSSDNWTHRYRMDFSFYINAPIPTFT